MHACDRGLPGRSQARTLLDSIDVSTLVGLRDHALIALMTYSFACVSAAVAMDVEDYHPKGKRWWVRLHEKGGKRHELPAPTISRRISAPISRRSASATSSARPIDAPANSLASRSTASMSGVWCNDVPPRPD
jgi:site-specific recombinase XerC